MIRIFDVCFSLIGLVMSAPILVVVCIIGVFDTGSPLFLQTRMGKHKRAFTLIKFRTMNIATKSVASHLVEASEITQVGAFLRKSKLDELPQLINVLKGDMSLVGPRPNLFNQEELINQRENKGVYTVRPGITGVAQINNIDMSTPEKLSEVDQEMIDSMSVSLYFKCIFMTVLGKGSGDAVS